VNALPPRVGVQQIQLAFAQAGVTGLAAKAYEQFVAYLELLLRWNARLNLTALRDPQQIVQRHFVECAFAAQRLPVGMASLLDYGSGAGFPGIPIAICRPEIRVTLAESLGKKAAFLREALRAVGMPGEIVGDRVEALSSERVFDVVTLRAVEKMELAIPVAMRRAGKYLAVFTTDQSVEFVQAAAKHRNLDQEAGSRFEWLAPIPLPNSREMILLIAERIRG
jgi:16S rRNA (guanine527-N7)-methyltransferase